MTHKITDDYGNFDYYNTFKRSKIIAKLNDELRAQILNANLILNQSKNKIVFSHDVSKMSEEDQKEILQIVRDYKTFSEDNNPHGEKDFGAFNFCSNDSIYQTPERYFWQINYYDNDLKYHSDDATDSSKTTRVLTIMKASEY
tara:strand:+ start:726 stop:1154 length:429 start_codon:yes stop_codon:yes gene_type:complete